LQIQSKFRLLVVRLGAMGDILHALPAVTALRRAHPAWTIDWVVEPKWRALLTAKPLPASEAAAHSSFADGVEASQVEAGRGEINRGEMDDSPSPHPEPGRRRRSHSFLVDPAQPVVSSLHLAATRAWRNAPLSRPTLRGIRLLRQGLKAGEYDVVLDLQGAIRSSIIARMAGARRVIGEASPREKAAAWLFTELVDTAGTHVIEQGLELAAAIAGDELLPATPWLPVDPAAEAWADTILPRDFDATTVLLLPGAGWGAKRWPTENFAAVARALAGRGARVLVNVGPGEEPLAQAIAAQAGSAVSPLQCSLEQLIALTRRVHLAIGGDTGPLHLACALGRPVVGIYGPTDPGRNGPYGTAFRVLRSPASRRDHTRHSEPEAGLLTITPDQVLHAAEELLAEAQVR
jgi:heptosyltransferase-1